MSGGGDHTTTRKGFGRVIWCVVLVFAFASLIFLATLPLTWKDQAVLGVLLIGGSYFINRISPSQRTSLCMLLVACFCTARYAYYRYSETFRAVDTAASAVNKLDIVFALLLLAAESYAFLVLFLGAFQTIRPLRRKPIPMPGDASTWPTIDVFIPTYNESLDVVKTTVLAALNMDWPPDRYAVYILDDGSRHEFQEFAESCGAHYFTRLDNVHAKAGNINNALKQTNGEYVAIFDCDHIPTRSFLQLTLGWFLADSRLGMLQTPHQYYSPDPFERNLNVFRDVPNEGALFYGIIQDGNDFWNATFFCGSCAVLRRTAIEEIGGVAVETVTEDAHTALRLQSRGWNTAYINLPLAAGLATTRLVDHIGQRIRWARGMVQILRTDNPLFLRGLKLPQRLCYFNATLHFLFAAPRLIFLTAPLVYLILGHKNVFGYLPAILAYGFPHLVVATMTNSRLQGKYRHSFWNEIYEIALAPYILIPTALALVNPRWGAFNVTSKSAVVEGTHFDVRIARPFILLLILNAIGVCMGVWKYVNEGDPNGVYAVNIFWALFNMMLLSATIAVANEVRQRRSQVRVKVKQPIGLVLPDGQLLTGTTLDLSTSGVLARFSRTTLLAPGESASVTLALPDGDYAFPVSLVDCWGAELRFAFKDLDLEHQAALAVAMFSRADSWLDWNKQYRVDRPIQSLLQIARMGFRGLAALFGARSQDQDKAETPVKKPAKRARAGTAALLVVIFSISAVHLNAAPQRGERGVADSSFRGAMSLVSLGYKDGVLLRSAGNRQNVYFGIPITKLVTNASMAITYRVSSGVAGGSQINLFLNGSAIGMVPITGGSNTATVAARTEVSIPPELMMTENILSFELVGSCNSGCTEDVNGFWAAVEPATEVRVAGTLLPVANNLALLPAPFFDASSRRVLELPFVMESEASSSILEAAGIVASWFGVKADDRSIRFPVRFAEIPPGNVVLICTSSSPLAALLGIRISGPAVLMRDNPNDSYGKVLAILGDNERQVLTAARGFALEKYSRTGNIALVDTAEPAPPREPYDAPKWLRSERQIHLTNRMADSELQVTGSGTVNLYFRLPPDLYYGSRETVPLRLRYRSPRLLAAKKATVKVFLNGNFLAERPVPIDSLTEAQEEIVALPAASLYPRNTLAVEFTFDRVRLPLGVNRADQPAVLRSTELLIEGTPHFVEMPRLDLFASTGFPFTRVADLSDTLIVLPPRQKPEEISLYLTLMGFMGSQTGYPGLGVTVLQGDHLGPEIDKDILLVGTFADQALLRNWADRMMIRPDGDRLVLNQGFELNRIWEKIPWTYAAGQHRALELLLQGDTPLDGVVQGLRSPVGARRSVVVISAPVGRTLEALADEWAASANAFQIQGNVSLFYNGSFRSFYLAGESYTAGQLPGWQGLQFWGRKYYWVAPLAVFVWFWIVSKLLDGWLDRRAFARLQPEE